MAICHISISVISRGKGKTAVSAAAYRAGEEIKSDYDGRKHSYLRKSGIVHKEIMLPENAPEMFKDRSILWNSVEINERYKTAQLARELVIALPVELSLEQNIKLAREYVQKNFVDAGMCADLCVHDTGDGNPHVHIMLTMRPIEIDGAWGQKSKTINGQKIPSVDWNEHSKAEEWRKAWADMQNEYLRRQKINIRVDHRSFERQGVYKVPTIHLGPASFRLEKRGIRTVRGDYNRDVKKTNSELRQLNARIKAEKDNLYSLPIVDFKSALNAAYHQREWDEFRTQWQKINDLKNLANIHNFVSGYGIRSMDDVFVRTEKIYDEYKNVASDIKAVDKRLNQLDEHKINTDIYNMHLPIMREYNKLSNNKNKQEAFYFKHVVKFEEFKAAKQYLDNLMKGEKNLPIKEWEKEKKQLYAERWHLCDKYYDLRKEIKAVEGIRRGAEKIIGYEPIDKSPKVPKNKPTTDKTSPQKKSSIREDLAAARVEVDKRNSERTTSIGKKKSYDLDR